MIKDRGDIIYREGEHGSHMYIILKGVVNEEKEEISEYGYI